MPDVEGRTTLGTQVGPRESDCVHVGVMLSINKSPRELSRATRISRKDLFSRNYEALPFHLRYKRCRTGSLYSFFFLLFFSPSSKKRVTTRRVSYFDAGSAAFCHNGRVFAGRAPPPQRLNPRSPSFRDCQAEYCVWGAPTRRNCITPEIIPSAHKTLSR